MIAAASLASLCVGAALSYASTRVSERTERYELWGGRLVLAGLVLIGAGLPLTR